MKTELEKLRSRFAKVEAELDKNRTSVLQDGWQTSRFAKKSRKWDILAQEKMNLKQRIENLESGIVCPVCGDIGPTKCNEWANCLTIPLEAETKLKK